MTKQKFLYQLGMCIRKYRQLAGMSQEKLGSVIHYDKNTIGKIERGDTDLKISTLLSISSGLNTSCFRILKEADTFSMDSYDATKEYDYLRLYQYCRKLSPEQFNLVCNAAHLYAKDNEK